MRKPLDCNVTSPRGRKLFRTFHDLEPTNCYEQPVTWPRPQGLLARASAIGYYSKKWDLVWKSFIHEHCDPLPQILMQYKRGLTSKVSRQFKPPQEYVVLGHCLDIEMAPGTFNAKKLKIKPDSEGFGHLDFKYADPKKMPLLCADPDRNILIVIPKRTGKPALLLWSPIMYIDERGIIY